MMIKRLMLFFIFTQPAFALDPLSELINKLGSSNELNCEEMTHDELAEHCVLEVCGPPASKTSRLTKNNVNKFLTPTQQEEFKNLERDIKAVVNTRKQEAQGFINELEKRVSDPKFKDTSNWSETDYSHFSNFFWKYITWDVDINKPFGQRSSLIIDEEAAGPLLPGVREYSEEFNKTLHADPLYAYNSGVFDFDDFRNAIHEKAKKLKEELATQNVEFDFDKYVAELSVIEEEEGAIIQLQKLETLANENGVVLIPNESHCKGRCKEAVNHFVSNMNIDSVIGNLKTSLEDADIKDIIAECKANFISINHQNNLSDNFEKMWPEVKAKFLQNVLPRFSSHSQGMMKDYLDNGVHFYFENPTYDEFPNLQEMARTRNENLTNKSNGVLLGDITKNLYDKDTKIFYRDIEVCDPYDSPSLIWDNYMAKENMLPFFNKPYQDPQKDNISVSPYTCEHHREGSGILAHELGHAFSFLMNREGMSTESLRDYRKIRSCASTQWDVSAPSERSLHPGDTQFTEEDSADIISYLAINDGQSLYACGFLGVNSEGTNYQNFDTEPWGVHSPSLIRLMREMSYKKSNIPKTCNALMQKHQDKLGDEKCF